jgi:hypothetical protein
MATTKENEKKLTYKEAIEALGELIGTQAPIAEADAFRKQLSTVGNQEAQVPPEIQEKVEELQKRTKEATSSHARK